ncbi:M3 family metallopeptidase [Chitinimonas sp.]|uniref:M3 family metallopeptidase n=1 Tax=Chitinimonas sp. TaxID=1934313 RepID=UPI002F9379E8
MSRTLSLLLAGAMLLAGTAPHAAPLGTADNPLLYPSTLPYQLPAFDRIRTEHFRPAYLEGMREQQADIARIAGNPATPTFDNTILALERSGVLLKRTKQIFDNLSATWGSDEMDALHKALIPRLAANSDATLLNSRLYARIAKLHAQREHLGLDAESLRLLDYYHQNFVLAGARLSDADKAKLKRLNAELAVLQNGFSLNVQKDSNAGAVLVEDRSELAGLSEQDIATAAAAAKAKGEPGKYLLALTNTTGQPQEDELDNRALRQRLYEASVNRGSHGGDFDNRSIVLRIAKLRAERARLLGYPDFASYALANQMASTPAAANQLLERVAAAAVKSAQQDARSLQAMITADGKDFQLAPWDWGYYTEKVRKAHYDYSESELRPYFELNRVLQDGLFYAATQLYGITFKERRDLPVYQPDVRVFEVSEADGQPLALILFDFYASAHKQGGAWMNNYVDQSGLYGTRPVVANHLNIQKPAAGQPTLLTSEEVETLFHEFGHGLHGMFSKVRYPSLSGANVPRDFVEYPSQFNEMWAFWPEVLRHYAKHYQTGADMPQPLMDKALAVRKFNKGFATTEYVAAALLDQRWHALTPEQVPTDVLAFESEALKAAGVAFAPIPPRYRSTYFLHTFAGGYAAGYYAYLWSDVLAADSSLWFRQHGGLTRANGDWFRQHILSRGNSADAMSLFRTFRGGEPGIAPLLEKRGLSADQP